MGGHALIGNPMVSSMIVMGYINMGTNGSAQIGMPGVNLVLSCQGTVTKPVSANIYATRDNSLKYTFSDPQFNVVNLADTYKTKVQSSLIISGNFTLKDSAGFSYSRSSGANSLNFAKAVDGKWILDISGNVIINGSLTIGGRNWSPLSTSTIYYRGSGIIYTTANITSNVQLIPINNFPEQDILVFISDKDINFDVFNIQSLNIPYQDCASANIYTVAIAKGNISLVYCLSLIHI